MSTFTSVNILKRKTPIKNTTVLSCQMRKSKDTKSRWGRRGRDYMVVGFTTTYAISAYCTGVVSSNHDQGKVYNIM
jgi:hypothetical protein